MKSKIIKVLLLSQSLFIWHSCADLDLFPLSETSTGTWFKDEQQFELSVNNLLKLGFWETDDEEWSDDYMRRQILTEVTSATVNSDWSFLPGAWLRRYKAIGRANTILFHIEGADLPQTSKNIFSGNAYFVRAAQYSYLIDHWGDVVHYTEPLDLEEAYEMGRTEKNIVLEAIYQDFDSAISKLPVSYSGKQYATKGAALAFKARIALHHQDWTVARDAAKECMDLGVYELYPDYGKLFESTTKNPKEVIFAMPASDEFGIVDKWPYRCRGALPRTVGGMANSYPTYELFCAYPCVDGLPIDESQLFNPREPFENRDPRLSETIVPFGEVHCGVVFHSHPDSTKVLNVETGKYINNTSALSVDRYAPFNGLLWKKGIDEFLWRNLRSETDVIMMRYADVLLMYAEAKIELNEIDQSVLDAINKVRARAYKVDFNQTSKYPPVITTNQAKLRKILRNERRIEFACEGLRYMDIIRWRLAEKVLNKPNYGLLPVNLLRERITSKGLWFFPEVPPIDEDWVADFGPMCEEGYYQILSQRQFDAPKQYLWPIPSTEIKICKNMEQNPGY